jgi:hypothetical protein
VRRNFTPFTQHVTGPVVNTNTGAEIRQIGYLDVPADAARYRGMEFRWQTVNTNLTGPSVAYWNRGERIGAETGVSVHRLYGVGWQSLRDVATQLAAWSDAQLTNFFAETRRLQLAHGLKPIVVMYVNSGLNDQKETLSPSLGWRGSTSPQSAAAYLDNLEAIVKRIEGSWALNGWGRARTVLGGDAEPSDPERRHLGDLPCRGCRLGSSAPSRSAAGRLRVRLPTAQGIGLAEDQVVADAGNVFLFAQQIEVPAAIGRIAVQHRAAQASFIDQSALTSAAEI